MKNRLIDVHNHLMVRLEALSDEDLSAEELDAEIKRAKASVEVSGAIVENARTVLDAAKFMASQGVKIQGSDMPMLSHRKRSEDD